MKTVTDVERQYFLLEKIHGYFQVFMPGHIFFSLWENSKGKFEVVTSGGVPAFQTSKENPRLTGLQYVMLVLRDQVRTILMVAVALPPYIWIMSHVFAALCKESL